MASTSTSTPMKLGRRQAAGCALSAPSAAEVTPTPTPMQRPMSHHRGTACDTTSLYLRCVLARFLGKLQGADRASRARPTRFGQHVTVPVERAGARLVLVHSSQVPPSPLSVRTPSGFIPRLCANTHAPLWQGIAGPEPKTKEAGCTSRHKQTTRTGTQQESRQQSQGCPGLV